MKASFSSKFNYADLSFIFNLFINFYAMIKTNLMIS